MQSAKVDIFLSCSLEDDDKEVNDLFESICTALYINTVNVETASPQVPPDKARELIKNSQALIAIAVKRTSFGNGEYAMPLSVSQEISMAYGMETPILLFLEENVSVKEGMLQNYATHLEFSRDNIKTSEILGKIIKAIYDLKMNIVAQHEPTEKLIYDNEPTEEIDSNFLSISLSRIGSKINIKQFKKVDRVTAPMSPDLWSKKVKEMQSFIFNNGQNEINDIGVALGVQNFIAYQGNKLLAGVRTKAIKHSYCTNSVIAKGAFNTGYKLFKTEEDINATIEKEDFQDLFVMHSSSSDFAKSFVKPNKKLHNEIISKTGHNNCILNINDHQYVCVIYINLSHYYPRYEIGICKYIEVKSSEEVINTFGKDKYENENYWIWVCDGKIKFRSFSSGKFIPNIKKKPEIAKMQSLLVSNQYLTKHFGIKGKYVPVTSDELL